MIAVDTNILIRYAVKDDPCRTPAATDFLKNNPCHVFKTVLLEFVWLLSSPSGYNLVCDVVVERLRHILGLPTLEAEDVVTVAQAIGWYERGMDIADALHLASSSHLRGFATMDRRLSAKATQIGVDRNIMLIA